jgi:hypothetical protein
VSTPDIPSVTLVTDVGTLLSVDKHNLLYVAVAQPKVTDVTAEDTLLKTQFLIDDTNVAEPVATPTPILKLLKLQFVISH